MADDLISLGGPGRGADRRQDADSAIETLFRAGYPRLVRVAHAAGGDAGAAERLAQDAYLRLWRRPRLLADPRAADAFLLRAVGGRPGGRAQPSAPPPAPAAQPADADRGWLELRLRRSRWERNRRTARIGAVTVVAAGLLAAAVPALLAGQSGARGPGPAGRSQVIPGSYPGAVVARIGLSGVIDLAGGARQVWAVRVVPGAVPASYQLVGIDTRTDVPSVRVSIGSLPEMVAAGGGTVWVTTSSGQGGGQLDRIDPVTGAITKTVHLRTGRCTFLAYSGARLFAGCASSQPGMTAFVGLDPLTGLVEWQSDSATVLLTQMAATPEGVWYADRYLGIAGPIGAGTRLPAGQVPGMPRPVSFASQQSLVYGDGFLWTLASDESVNKIDPASGRVARYYTSRGYDPAAAGGLDYLAVGDGALWFLDDRPLDAASAPMAGVLAVDEETGRPLGWVPAIAPRSCGRQPCSQIYATPGAIWVPTAQSLIRIAPARLPGRHP